MNRERPRSMVHRVLLAAAWLAASATTGCGDRHWRYPKSDVLLVVIDTLRADGLSSYGNPRRTSPNIDRLATEGVQFEVVFAQAPQTAASHASLFTGLYPGTHRVSNLIRKDGLAAGLPPVAETLAERFEAAGYETAAFTDGAVLGRAYGLDQGFETFDGRFEGVARKVDRALDFLAARKGTRPLFLFLHTYQIHQPYVPPRQWVERFDPAYDGPLRQVEQQVRQAIDRARAGAKESHDFPESKLLLADAALFSQRDIQYVRTLYDAAIAYTDNELNRLWTHLEDRGQLDKTFLVITSDHGEAFNERGHIGHRDLYRETTQVPLIVRLPGGVRSHARGVKVRTPVALVDVHLTLIEAMGIGQATGDGAIDLLEGLRVGRLPERPIFAETTDHYYQSPEERTMWQSVRSGHHVRLRRRDGATTAGLLFDTGADPGERTPLDSTPNVQRLANEMDELLDAQAIAEAVARRLVLADDPSGGHVPDEKTLRDLRSLGYVR